MKQLVNLILRNLNKSAASFNLLKLQPSLLIASLFLLLVLGIQPVFSQISGITGKIIDYETKRVMPGVTIIENLPGNGTVSDVDGNFKLKIKGDMRELELNFIGYYALKFVNIPNENEIIDFGELKLVKNHLLNNSGAGIVYKLSESDKEKDQETRKNVVEKYRIEICGNVLKPYFDRNKIIFDFTTTNKK